MTFVPTVQLSTPATGLYDQPVGLFINNEFISGLKGQTFVTINPVTEKPITSVHEATAEDVDIAVAAARKAFKGAWKLTTPEARGRCLAKLADLIEQNIDLISSVEALDGGKALSMAKFEVGFAASVLRYYGGWADKISGQVIDIDPSTFNYAKQEPLGVCGQIIPWNFPLLMWSWKIGPAVATGNTVVLKTAEQTPLSGLLVARFIKEAGFPPGVINIISGFGKIAGAAITTHMDIDKVAFTGSTAVGRLVMQSAAKSNLKKVTLELGGKSPNIVFDDADIDNAISWVNFGIFFNQGQTCCAGSRIYVQEGIYDKFIKRMRERAEKVVVGDPFAAETFQGPQVSLDQFNRVKNYIELGKKEGATLETGGNIPFSTGFFINPTIFSNVTEDMTIMKEEIFGPVAAVAKFKTEEEIIEKANKSFYGLASGVHTENLQRAIRVANALEAGTVWVNSYNTLHQQLPFGGYKQSGFGRELGETALQNYLQTKSVQIRLGGALFG
ncbi:aldehyde dehydrogenase [Xylogone sp. PMI_703]|nr:aldehyde dehydrogenase [Xylogone sp. PMI_703]